MKIVYWSDYACPYCYIGETRLKKAIKELGIEDKVEMEFKAFELNPYCAEFSTETTLERFAMKYRLSKEDAAAKIEEISQLGRAEGIDFRYATTRNTNTFKAHRVTKLAYEKGGYELADKVSELFFDAYFTKNLELANPDTLLSVAEQAGLDRDEVEAMLKSDRFKDEIRHDEREAELYGVQGVPFFILNDKKVIPGAFSTRAFKHTLEKLMQEELQVVEPEEEAVGHCGPDGCTFEPKKKA